MKRWLWLPLTALLVVPGCDNKDNKPATSESGSRSQSAKRAASVPRASDAVMASARRQVEALTSAASAVGPDSGRRFFDGQALRNNGFAVPDDSAVVVPAGAGSSRRALPAYTGSGRSRVSDLGASAPPSPWSGAYALGREASSSGAGAVLAAFDAFQRKMYDSAAPILSRSGWHAAKRKGEPVAMNPTHVTVHHTEGAQTMTEAETAAAVRGIQHYHMAGRAAEGKDTWDDIGYHFLIDGAGRVVEGRPAETLGAHAGGANEDNIGVAMMGNFDRQKPTAAQVESLTRLVSFLAIKYRQNPARQGFLEPHQHYDQTDCPGRNMMAILAQLRAKVDAQTRELQARLGGAGKGQFVPVMTSDA